MGLFQLAEQFTAMRQEWKLQAKGSRNLQEQTEAAIEAMEKSARAFQAAKTQLSEDTDRVARPMVEALGDLDEALERGRKAIEAARRRMMELLREELLGDLDRHFEAQRGWRKWLMRRWYRSARELLLVEARRIDTDIFASLLEGYGIIQNRLLRFLQQNRIERIPCVGEPVDPQRMTVIDLVERPEFPPGYVAEEIRPGYLWNGKVVRYAEVKAVGGATGAGQGGMTK